MFFPLPEEILYPKSNVFGQKSWKIGFIACCNIPIIPPRFAVFLFASSTSVSAARIGIPSGIAAQANRKGKQVPILGSDTWVWVA